MAVYVLGDKKVTEEEFNKAIKTAPFFLDEVIYINSFSGAPLKDEICDNKFEKELLTKLKNATVDMSKAKGKNVFESVSWISDQITAEENKKIEEIREACLNTRQYLGLEDVTKILKAESEEELEYILKKDMSIGAPDWSQQNKIGDLEGAYNFKLPFSGAVSHTGGTVFEQLQDSTLPPHSIVTENLNKAQENYLKNYLDLLNSEEKSNKQAISNDIAGTKPKTLPDNYLKGAFNYPIKDKYRINFYKYVNNNPILEVKEFEDLLIAGEYFNKSDYTEAFIYEYGTSDLVNTWNKIEDEKVGKKETENKTDYSEINLEILDLMANRFSANKHKYPKGNSLKKLNKQDILWAAFRHIKKMIQPIEGDPESYVDHLAAVCTNMSIILDQLKIKDKNE